MKQSFALSNYRTSDFWENRANKVLSHFNYRYPDEIDMSQICWRYGIDIMPLDTDFFDGEITEDMKAFSVPKGIRKGVKGTIYLLPKLEVIEKKIILAEEFCHLHAHLINQISADKYQINKCEQQAKKMAAYLLMPYRFLIDLLKCDQYEHAVLISEIADYFLVTEEFAHFRMELLFKHRVDMITKVAEKIGTIQWLDD